jgi:hypothetical protein
MERARRGVAMDAEELALLQMIAAGHSRACAAEGCHLALSIRGYARHDFRGDWQATQQGEWFLGRVGQFVAPMHVIERQIMNTEIGCGHLIRGDELPTDAVEALEEAQALLLEAAKRVQAAIGAINRPATAAKE